MRMFLALHAGIFRVNNLTERWPSGLRRTPAKRVYPKRVPRVQIPLSPPLTRQSARSSIGQSTRLRIWGLGVQIPPGAPVFSKLTRHNSGSFQLFSFSVSKPAFLRPLPRSVFPPHARPLIPRPVVFLRLGCQSNVTECQDKLRLRD
jgi:hypothetical protein